MLWVARFGQRPRTVRGSLRGGRVTTGYTQSVKDGTVTDFRTFALQCARAFGACVEQRDEAGNALPKLSVASDYHAVALAEAERRMTELEALTPEQVQERSQAAFAEAVQRHLERVREQGLEQARYAKMLDAVERWTPPTPEHQGLKDFMREQLCGSITFDHYKWEPPKAESGADWIAKERESASRDMTYHREEGRKEAARVAERNAWITALYGAL